MITVVLDLSGRIVGLIKLFAERFVRQNSLSTTSVNQSCRPQFCKQQTMAGKNEAPSGVWVGVDWGTTNSAVAVYDRTRGDAKWIRLSKSLGGIDEKTGKPGRLLPTVLLVATRTYVEQHYHSKNTNLEWQDLEEGYTSIGGNLQVLLGAAAQTLLEEESGDPVWNNAVVSSTKRRILKGDESISIVPAGLSRPVTLKCVDIVTIFLKALRLSATRYLQSPKVRKKHLDVPCSSVSNSSVSLLPSTTLVEVCHCCVGVPASATVTFKSILRQAAMAAGLGTVRLLTESTAAAMAYGLSLQHQDITKMTTKQQYHTILVLDMGGGTTDVTIARKQADRVLDQSSSTQNKDDDDDDDDVEYTVLKSIGDNALGGDDMDEALRCACQAPETALRQVRKAKVELCNGIMDKVRISWKQKSVSVTMAEFEQAIQPLMDRLRHFVVNVSKGLEIDEAILVGGATRVPSVQRTLHELFPTIELCRSVQPDSAVAKGCAIAAALEVLPRHELQSAFMMDTNPHPIGVYSPPIGDSPESFVEILPAGAPLPAHGSAIFTLASAKQPGVSLRAVERVGDGQYEPVGEFTFLLRRLDPLPAVRTVEISMLLKDSGEFIVSIFDEYDPEHLNKRHKGDLKYNEVGSPEQTMLIVGCIAMLFLYIVVRIAFPPEDLGIEK